MNEIEQAINGQDQAMLMGEQGDAQADPDSQTKGPPETDLEAPPPKRKRRAAMASGLDGTGVPPSGRGRRKVTLSEAASPTPQDPPNMVGDRGGLHDFGRNSEEGTPDQAPVPVPREIRLETNHPLFLRFFTSKGVRRRVHWLPRTKEHPTRCIECPREGCPVCELNRPPEWRNGLPVLDLETYEVGVVQWNGGAGDDPTPHSCGDMVKSGLAAADPKVLLATRLSNTQYQWHVVKAEDLVGMNLGDVEIADFLEDLAHDRVTLDVWPRLNRGEILQRFPEVARAATLAARIGAGSGRATKLQRLKELYRLDSAAPAKKTPGAPDDDSTE